MNENGQYQRELQGSKWDLGLAYLFRIVAAATLFYIARSSMESHDILIKGDIPQMQRDIQELKVQGQKYITQDQLTTAIRSYLDRLNIKPVTTDLDAGKHYEK